MLISHSSLLLFVTGAALLLVIPGPAVTYLVSRSIGHGRAAGLVSVMGIVVGTLLHVTAATLGLSALLASSALAFQFIKYLGAAYLIYLGIRTLRRDDSQLLQAANGERRLLRIFAQGVPGQSAESKDRLVLFLPSCPSCGPIPGPSQPANFPIGSPVCSHGLDQRFGVGGPRWHRGRPFPRQHPPASRSTKHIRRRSHRPRFCLRLLGRQNEMIPLNVSVFAVSC